MIVGRIELLPGVGLRPLLISFLYSPLHWADNQAEGFPRSESMRERQARRTSQTYYNLILEVLTHPVCCILFIRSESFGPLFLKMKGLYKSLNARTWNTGTPSEAANHRCQPNISSQTVTGTWTSTCPKLTLSMMLLNQLLLLYSLTWIWVTECDLYSVYMCVCIWCVCLLKIFLVLFLSEGLACVSLCDKCRDPEVKLHLEEVIDWLWNSRRLHDYWIFCLKNQVYLLFIFCSAFFYFLIFF